MKLILSQPRGFCAGVVRAIETVEKSLKLWGPPIYVKHQIVHNKHVVNSLKAKGAIFIEDLASIPKGSRVIYSAHGVSPEIRKEAKRLGLIEIDATCGLVMKIHSAAKHFSEIGYKIILIGHKNHVEIIGTEGEAPTSTTIVESVKDVEKLSFLKDQKLLYLTQTTLSLYDVEKIVSALKQKFPLIETIPTSSICYATTNRQKALSKITDLVDLVLIVGDPTSSNSNRLKEVALNKNMKAYLINSEEEIDPSWLKEIKTIGMTAGASTPEDVVQRCIQRLIFLGVKEVEEITYFKEDVVFPLPSAVVS
jgi:4-hydroxy-3-methylbut-2-en-1-yl diphosphate reductase